jgi:hypothetical protein
MSKYKISSREEGTGNVNTLHFETLQDASKYIQERWQGMNYRDGIRGFHTDNSIYLLVGFTFNDIGHVEYSDPNDVDSRYFVFNDPIESA